MREQIDTTVALSVRVSIRNLAIIGTYLDATGLFTAAQPSGALAYAVKMFADIIVANGLALQPQTLIEALVMIKRLRYPKGQVEKALLREDVAEGRAALRRESQEVLGATTQGFVRVKQAVKDMESRIGELSPEQKQDLMDKAAFFWDEGEAQSATSVESRKAEMFKLAHAAGIVSDDTRSAEEINAERAALDAERLQREKDAILVGIKGAGVAIANEDEFGEFTTVAEEIVAAQPYVVNADPAEVAPGVLETQAALRKELEEGGER